jgi:tRNA(fMet)-specific endonuclease VapC
MVFGANTSGPGAGKAGSGHRSGTRTGHGGGQAVAIDLKNGGDDTVRIYIIKKKPPQVLKRFSDYSFSEIGISSITLSELEYGVEKSAHPDRNREALLGFVSPLEIAPYDDLAATHYGRIRAQLERAGYPIGAMDLLIAAHARSMAVPLVTNNLREFGRIKGLTVENWLFQRSCELRKN